MDIKKLCEDSHRLSKEKGWLDNDRSFSAVASLIHSELSEALEDFRKHRGVGEVYYEVKLVNGATIEVPPESMRAMKARSVKNSEYVGEPKPCGIPIELADVLIRIAQFCGTEGLDLQAAIQRQRDRRANETVGNFEDTIAFSHLAVSLSFAASQGMRELVADEPPLHWLAICFKGILSFCEEAAIDIEGAISIKQAYNATRAYRHGNKKL